MRAGKSTIWRFVVAALALFASAPVLAQGDFIRTQGTRLVDSRGQTFAIKSINLGNWLVPEGYMIQFKRSKSPREIAAVVEALIGRERRALLGDLPRHLHHGGRHPLHQGGRLQHRASATALRSVL